MAALTASTALDQFSTDHLIALAESQNRKYPQYRGHWVGWKLAIAKKTVKTKMGIAFEKGDFVIVKPEVRDLTSATFSNRKSKLSVTVYSFKNEMNTSVWLDELEVDSSEFPVTAGD